MSAFNNTELLYLQEGSGIGAARRRTSGFAWPRSLGLNLGVAAIVGFLYSLWVMGPTPLNPRNISWLTFDSATYQIAWELYRQDPKMHWPITFTDRLAYPEGESISLHDPNPLMAVLLKPFSRFLPEPFQYLGLEVALICTLQFFFALILFRLLLGPNPFAVVLPALFFLIAPPLTYRFVGHYAISNHWLILAGIFLLCLAQRKSSKSTARFIVYAAILACLAVAINPYVAFQVLFLLVATVASLIWQRRLTLPQGTAVVAALGITSCAVAYAFGYFMTGGGYSGYGYRLYSLNLLTLIDPLTFGSLLLPKMPHIFQQYEGYSYLGLGVILLILVVLPILVFQRHKYPLLKHRVFLPVLACCVILTALALSTRVMFGSWVLVDLDPREKLSKYFAVFRASGRFFWTPYYILLTAVLAATFRSLRKSWAITLIGAALVVQWLDTNGLRRWVHSEVNQRQPSPLHSPVWSKLGAFHKNLLIMPPWQCNTALSPGGTDGYRIFGFLAAAQRMRINSYYAARYSETAKAFDCDEAISDLSRRPLSPDSAYVVIPVLAQKIAEGPTGKGKCHNVDQFILCSSNSDFGLNSIVSSPAERLNDAIANAGFEDNDLSNWGLYQNVTAVTSSLRAHTGTRSLAETTGAGSLYQDVTGLEPGRKYAVTAWVSSSNDATATAQIAIYDPGTNVATFSTSINPRQGWLLLTDSVTVSAHGALRIHLFRNQGSGTVFWDDVRIYREK
jgi:Family of unknown function (DUF6311)/Carbohydrate binding domain